MIYMFVCRFRTSYIINWVVFFVDEVMLSNTNNLHIWYNYDMSDSVAIIHREMFTN